MNNHNDKILQVTNLSKSYSDGKLNTTVLKDVNFTAHRQETIAIVGASGSGKSTLMHLMGGLDTPDSGEVCLLGQSLNRLNGDQRGVLRNQHLGFVYQFHHLLREFSAVENVAMPLRIAGEKPNSAIAKAKTVLSEVGLDHRFEHRPSELSGGERQRVAIARSVVTEPDCVLADEPTGNLDRKTADIVFDSLLKLNQQYGMCIIMVTHDNILAERMSIQTELIDGVLRQN